MKGIRLLASLIFDSGRDWGEKILDTAAKTHVPVQVSVYPPMYDNLSCCAEWAEQYPDVSLILGQIYSLNMWPLATILANKFDNIYLEVGPTSTQAITEAERRIGTERLILGSMAPMTRPRAIIDHVNLLDLTESARAHGYPFTRFHRFLNRAMGKFARARNT